MRGAAASAIGPLAALLAAFFLGAAIYGAWLNFSPVPMADSWDGMVDFYLRAADPMAWWEKHNEHRIVLSKILFWLDMRYFDGRGLLLVPLNILLLMLVARVLMAYADKLIAFASARERLVVGGMLVALSLAWMQHQNILFSFQSMFILVFLLPLLSFYCLARALENPTHALRWRLLAIALGGASTLCMANGIFALPLLALLSAYGERSPRWFIAIGLCAAVALALFMMDYRSSIGSAEGVAKLASDPLYIVKFALVYLGGPFYTISGRLDVALAAGMLAVAAPAYLFWRMAALRANPFALGLLAYIAYVFVAAAMTAFGRVLFPLAYAATSRYTTPTLIMWSALLILLLACSRLVRAWSAVALVAVAALLLPAERQAFALNTDMHTPQVKAVGALGLRMGIDDRGAKSKIALFYSRKFEDVVARARERKVAIFADAYAWPADRIGTPLRDAGGQACKGRLTFHNEVDKTRSAYKIGGELAPDTTGKYRYILFGDEQGLVRGIAIPGRDADGRGGAAGPLNFDGYIFARPEFSELRCIP